MENRFEQMILMHGLKPSDFTITSYRAPGQGLNENGRGCRVLYRDGNALSIHSHHLFFENADKALSLMLEAVSDAPVRTPILDLLAQYEGEMCDFEDRKGMADVALTYASTMPDSHVRCLLYALARIVKGDPYMRPRRPKEPCGNVENVAALFRLNRERLLQAIHDNYGVEIEMSLSVRTSNLKSGVVQRIYGKFKYKNQYDRRANAIGLRPIFTFIGGQLQEYGGLKAMPVLYTTSGSQTSCSFRMVVDGEEDYDNWKHYT